MFEVDSDTQTFVVSALIRRIFAEKADQSGRMMQFVGKLSRSTAAVIKIGKRLPFGSDKRL